MCIAADVEFWHGGRHATLPRLLRDLGRCVDSSPVRAVLPTILAGSRGVAEEVLAHRPGSGTAHASMGDLISRARSRVRPNDGGPSRPRPPRHRVGRARAGGPRGPRDRVGGRRPALGQARSAARRGVLPMASRAGGASPTASARSLNGSSAAPRGTPASTSHSPPRSPERRATLTNCEFRTRVPLLRPAADRARRDAVPAGHDRGRVDVRGCRRRAEPDLPPGRARGDPAADRRGDARHRALPAPGAPRAAAPDHRRPGGVGERPLRRARPAQERQHLRGRRAADVPGHRHRDRDGQEVRGRAHRRRRRRGDLARGVRRLHEAQPALLPARAADHVGGEEHRHQPARADRDLRDRGPRQAGVQVPLHGQGRRLGQQVLPLPGDEGGPEPHADAAVPRREDPLARHRRLPAVPPGRGDRRYVGGVRAQDREVRLGALPRQPPDRGDAGRARLPRPRAGGGGLQADPVVRDRRAVRRQVLLPRRARRTPPAARRLVPGRDRGVVLGGPAGARQDHRRGRVPRAARDRPGEVPARHAGAPSRPTRPTSSGSTSTGRWPTSSPS